MDQLDSLLNVVNEKSVIGNVKDIVAESIPKIDASVELKEEKKEEKKE